MLGQLDLAYVALQSIADSAAARTPRPVAAMLAGKGWNGQDRIKHEVILFNSKSSQQSGRYHEE